MVERAFYDKTLKYDPAIYPGVSSNLVDTNATIYLKRNTSHQAWFAGNMQSTGLFAPAHTDVTITLPNNADETKVQLIIGNGDNVGGIFRHEVNLKRPPKYVKKYKFLTSSGDATKTITVQHPYGGLIYLKSFDSSKDEGDTASVDFTGVQKAIRFVLGTTTESQWNDMVSNNTAPKAEVESHHYIVTVARANVASKTFAQITTIAQNYDTLTQNAYDFYGYDRDCVEPYTEHTPPSCTNDKKQAYKNRETHDPHISIGSAHSGYPIAVQGWNKTSTNFPTNPLDSWLMWHEMGHNMASKWLNIAGSTEVANNVMALYQQHKNGLTPRVANSISNVSRILAKGQPWADGGNFGRLLMFYQIAKWTEVNYLATFKSKNSKYYENGSPKAGYEFLDGSGYDLFKILHRESRDSNSDGVDDKYDVCRKANRGSNTKTDMLAICLSAILELNTKPFFQTWKAGTVGIGNIDGVNIYSDEDAITSSLDTGYADSPNPSISSYDGN
jgi:accessory colonization factor AcfD